MKATPLPRRLLGPQMLSDGWFPRVSVRLSVLLVCQGSEPLSMGSDPERKASKKPGTDSETYHIRRVRLFATP